jgi:pimeloyl-ACP methyl ester carboxylesterase
MMGRNPGPLATLAQQVTDPMADLFSMRTGRTLEVREYGHPDGHPAFFFHGLIGSHHQAAYIADEARRQGLRIIAPNRPGVGRSEFVVRTSPLEVVADVEDVARALGIGDFSVIGISGGTPYALATLLRLGRRVRTATIISGMGPMQLPGALDGMNRANRLRLELGCRFPNLARRSFRKWSEHFRGDPKKFLDRLISTWSPPDRLVFRRQVIYDLFLKDLHAVFTEGQPAESLSQQLYLYGHYGFSLDALPVDRRVSLWQGLADTIVPPVMSWKLAQAIPNCEAHFVPGGHFMAVDFANRIVSRLKRSLDAPHAA